VAQPYLKRTPIERLRRQVTTWTLPYPERFRVAAQLGVLARPFSRWLPAVVRPLLELLPDRLPTAPNLPVVAAAHGSRRARVALLTGCAQQVLEPDINAASVEVLVRQGVEVVIPPGQGCCGGLSWHTGDLEAARRFARHNLEAFPQDVDAILTNAAGCGSALHEYPLILRGTPDEARAQDWARRVEDISAFLARIGFRPPRTALKTTVTYQDACHLANAQGVRNAPRELLRALPGVELRELAGTDLCCGSAGTYNLDQPDLAARLGEAKARALLATGAEQAVSGNIGCLTQLNHHLRRLGAPLRVRHTVQFLRDALRADDTPPDLHPT
jgi:glycolate oxidase iron-sulfur subunit